MLNAPKSSRKSTWVINREPVTGLWRQQGRAAPLPRAERTLASACPNVSVGKIHAATWDLEQDSWALLLGELAADSHCRQAARVMMWERASRKRSGSWRVAPECGVGDALDKGSEQWIAYRIAHRCGENRAVA